MRTPSRERIRTLVGPVGAFLGSLALQSAEDQRTALPAIERAGYGSLWCGEAVHREAFSQAAIALGASSHLVVATGIANIWTRDATAMAAGARTLAEAWPDRFILGIGVSHPPLLRRRGLEYGRPLESMARYLGAMRSAPFESPAPVREPPVILAALGPRMLELAGTRTDGAFTFFCPVEHTFRARQMVGAERFLAVEQAVVLEQDPAVARARSERHLRRYLQLENYRANLRRLGWDERELQGAGSERLFESLVAWGDPQAVANRLREHLDAGADHVVVNLLARSPGERVESPLREIAEAATPSVPVP